MTRSHKTATTTSTNVLQQISKQRVNGQRASAFVKTQVSKRETSQEI